MGFRANIRGQLPRRRVVAGAPSLQEAAGGATPFAGFDASTNLASGEVLRFATDLTFQTRPDTFACARAYRLHLDETGPLGPGWQLNHWPRLARIPAGVRLLAGDGKLHDFLRGQTPRGLFHTLSENLAIDATRSAFQLLGPQRDELHFHSDGRLRFVRDRCGNVTRFHYNERAQLIEITDPLHRAIRFAYYVETDPVPTETHGRLKSITGPDGRIVDYVYYGAGDLDGRAGWLKTVLRPAAPTLRGTQLDPNYRRQETYRYHVASDPALDGALREVLDSENNVLATIGYDAERRVATQRYGGGELRVAYPSPRVTVVDDRDDNRVTWTFRASPDADGAAPLNLVEHANRNLRPGQGDVTTRYECNRDGLLTACEWPDGTRMGCVYDDANASVRSRANLLMLQRFAAGGAVRTSTWRYTSRYNLVTSFIPPEGHATPGMARRYETICVYDHQAGAGDHGNVVRITRPRVLNAVMILNAANRDELRWIHENPTVRIAYNSFGLPVRIDDECGVVTTLAYYPENQPEGGIGVASSAAGGGFLARVEHDGMATPARDLHLPAVPLAPQATQIAYDPRGDIRHVVDALGNEHNFVFNGLRQLASMEIYATAPASALRRADPLREQFHYRADGLLALRELQQTGASPLAGGDVLRSLLTRDTEGRLRECQADTSHGMHLREGWDLTREGLLETLRLPGALAGISPDETLTARTDERGLLLQLLAPNNAGQTASTGFEVTPRGRLSAVISPTGGRTDLRRDRFGDLEGAALPDGLEFVVVSDAAGRTVADVTRGPAPAVGATPPVLRFSEYRHDEEGRRRREHFGLLALDPTGTAPTHPVPSTFEGAIRALGLTWPPTDRSTLEDEAVWGRGDGRVSRDLVWDTRGAVTRVLSDDNHLTWTRRDARGRVLVCADGEFTRLAPRYHPTGELSEMLQESRATSPLDNRVLTLRHRLDRDSAGNLFRLVDAQGRAHAVELDSTNHVLTLTDARGPLTNDTFNNQPINAPGNRTRLFFDGGNRLNRVETDLTIDGHGGSAPEPNRYNLNARAGFELQGDPSGRVVGFVDQAGHHYAWQHDRGGRLISVVYPANPAAPGGAIWDYTYDGSNRVETVTDPNGTRTRVIYGPNNRIDGLRVEQYGGGSAGPEGYDFTYENERIATATEWRAPTMPTPHPLPPSFLRVSCREPDGQVIREQQAGLVITARFDTSGRRELVYPNGGPALIYFIDGQKLVREMEFNRRRFAKFEYLGDEVLASCTNGPITTKYEYTEAGDLLKLTVSGLASGDIVYEMTHDRGARFASWTRTHGSVTESRDWLRDSLGRIIREIATYPAGHPLRERTLRRYFDGDSVLCEIQLNDVDVAGTALPTRHIYFARADAGRIVRRDQTRLEYDANGNLRFDGRWRFTYDFMSRLVSAEDTQTQQTTRHFHDGLGRRYLTITPTGAEETYGKRRVFAKRSKKDRDFLIVSNQSRGGNVGAKCNMINSTW